MVLLYCVLHGLCGCAAIAKTDLNLTPTAEATGRMQNAWSVQCLDGRDGFFQRVTYGDGIVYAARRRGAARHGGLAGAGSSWS